MKKGRILLFTLIVILLVVSVKYIKLSIEHDRQQNSADMALKSSLILASDGFALDFSNISMKATSNTIIMKL